MAAADEQAPQFQVYVSPVPKDMDDAAFAKAFAGCGAIDQARVVRKSRSSKLFGFVDFKEKAGADAAIAGMNGKSLEGSDDTIEVSESKPKKPRPERAAGGAKAGGKKKAPKEAAPLDPKRLYAGKLSGDTTDESLSTAFGAHGKLAECYVVKSTSGRHFGFATFEDESAAKAALASLNGSTLDGAEIEVSQAKSEKRSAAEKEVGKASRPKKASKGVPESRIFVGQLPYSVNNTALRQAFEKFGEILEAYVVYKDRRSRRFGFVIYKEPADANKALAAMNGFVMGKTESFEGSPIDVQMAGKED